MRIATVHQRASLIVGAGAVDIHEASGGRFGPGAADLYERRAGFVDWAAAATLPDPGPYAPDSLGSPSPTPRQVFGIGLNHGAHAAESGFARPQTAPPVFTKFPSCITGPYGEVVLPADGHTDWEVELGCAINGEQNAKGPCPRPDLRGGRSSRAAVLGDAAAARRPRLHRHAAGRRAGPYPAALA